MERADLDRMSAEQLVAGALARDRESEGHWECVSALRRRDDEPTFELLSCLFESSQARERALGADALGQFDGKSGPAADSPFAPRVSERLIAAAESEVEPYVVAAIASGLGHHRGERAVQLLAGWRGHPDEDVRWSVTFALGGEESDVSIQALIELTTDESSDVRDWATFGLGVIGHRDSAQIRQALVARLDDPNVQVRIEALSGLAQRGDDRVLPKLRDQIDHLDELEDQGQVSNAAIEMAARTGDPHLCAFVRRERDAWLRDDPDEPFSDELQAALAACQLPSDQADDPADQPG